jgi:hypothetical protein
VYRLLHGYKTHHAEVLFREDVGLEELIDAIEGNRKYVRCLYIYNKIDTLSIEEVDALARKPDSVVISIYMKLNIDYMLQKMWDYMGLLRIYTKRRGQAPDLTEPVVLSNERHGLTVEAACTSISKELLDVFNFALVWGKSTKFNPQRVGLTHTFADEDVLQVIRTFIQLSKCDEVLLIHTIILYNIISYHINFKTIPLSPSIQIVAKTVLQQKASKDYAAKVQAYNDNIQKERRRKHKIK